jgi:hypothetical protein
VGLRDLQGDEEGSRLPAGDSGPEGVEVHTRQRLPSTLWLSQLRPSEMLEEYVGALKLPRMDSKVVSALRRIYFARVASSPERPLRSLQLLGVSAEA